MKCDVPPFYHLFDAIPKTVLRVVLSILKEGKGTLVIIVVVAWTGMFWVSLLVLFSMASRMGTGY